MMLRPSLAEIEKRTCACMHTLGTACVVRGVEEGWVEDERDRVESEWSASRDGMEIWRRRNGAGTVVWPFVLSSSQVVATGWVPWEASV